MMAEPRRKEITKSMFRPATIQVTEKEELSGEAISYSHDAMRRLIKNKPALISLLVILFIVVMAIVGPHMNKYGVDDQDLIRHNLPAKVPAFAGIHWLHMDGIDSNGTNVYKDRDIKDNFWFGTDKLGRDLWTRVWKGTQISLIIGLVATLADLIIGVAYGGISAYFGGYTDMIMQRIIEVLMGIPQLVIIILLIMVLEPGLLSIIIAIAMTGWIGQSRIVRGQILKLKSQEYVLASRTLGAKPRRLIGRHLLPNTLGQIIITTMFSIPGAIFAEAFLSFIGIGIRPPQASLGSLINDGQQLIETHAYQVVFPALVLSLLLICFNVFADGLRDALDPKMRR